MGLADSYLPTPVSLPKLQGKILGFFLEDVKNWLGLRANSNSHTPHLFIVL
jgi:hypothetical protein